MSNTPEHQTYDVVIVGGAMMGSSTAWWTSQNPDFSGRILVVERDPTYEFASTSHTNSCIRQQFSNEINIRIGQFGVDFIQDFKGFMHDPEAPEIALHDYGYMYMAGDQRLADILIECQKIQSGLGAGTRIMTPEEVAAEYPFYNMDGVVLCSHNPLNEGYFDGGTVFDWFKRKARANGVEYVHNEVVSMDREGDRITAVNLKSGEKIGCGAVVNASGPRAAVTAQMAALEIPVEPRRRYTFIFDCETKLSRDLPLTIDPSGCHMRSDGRYFLAGCPPIGEDKAMAYDDFSYEDDVWEEKLWPVLANRVPAFERIKVVNSWVGHYAFNTLDANAVIGPHPDVSNFMFLNGFSGHGLQQSPAMGRGMSELLIHGAYQTLDLSELGYDRVIADEPFLEMAVI
ncbi:MAG: FAD-binding oxidoreductase [Pseudomonadota bacterium]